MSKPKSVHRDLPPRMTRRTWRRASGALRHCFYYEHPRDATGKRKLSPLGTDLTVAKMKWAELEAGTFKSALISPSDTSMASAYKRYLAWANDREKSTLAPRTIKDRERYWTFLEPVFGALPLDHLEPPHLMRYFDARSAKTSAKKEIRFLSVLCEWARARGFMRNPNPVTGIVKQLKVKEGRDIYVSDEMLELVRKHASPIVQDVLDLAYLTGQRPADVLAMRWNSIHEGKVEIRQGKTGKKLRIREEGDLKTLLDRIRARGIVGMTILHDPSGQPLKPWGYFRSAFDRARDAAEKEAAETGEEFIRFQLRDLRAKAATDLDDPRKAQRLLGHTNASTTRAYIRKHRGDSVAPVKRKKKRSA